MSAPAASQDSSRKVYASAAKFLRSAHFGPLVAVGALASAGHLAGQLSMPWIVGRIIDDALVSGMASELLRSSLWLAIAAVISALCQGIAKVAFADWGQRSLCSLQDRMLAHLHRLPVGFLDRHTSGRLNALFTSDAPRVASLFDPTLRELIYSVIQAVLLVILLYRGYGPMIVFAAALIPIYLLVPLTLAGRVRKISGEIQESAAAAQGLLQEAIEGVRESKILGDDRWILRRVNEGLGRAARQRVRGVRLRALYGVDYVLYWSAIGFVYWQGGLGVLRGDLSIGELVALVSYLGYLEAPVGRLLGVHAQVQGSAGALLRLDEFFCVAPEQEGSHRYDHRRPPVVEFRDVAFTYPGRDEPALAGINLRVRPGEHVAIVGPSGAGKSTLIKLLLRLHDPTEGDIYFDGVPLRQHDLKDLRSALALVPQEPFLFSLDVRENIRLGNAEASDSEVDRAAEIAHAHEFITELPRGFETSVGERGMALSVGQKQRIAIARASLRQAGIVLLDEATSALDAESEQKVRSGLKRLTLGRTAFSIAHRLQTVTEADRILVLDKGRLVAEGPHAEVLRTSPLYRRLYDLHFSAPTHQTSAETPPQPTAGSKELVHV